MNPDDGALLDLQSAHRQFMALVGEVRPELHRYCARMTGSVIEGEDVVQETLAHAYFELSQLREVPALKTWLFRIAHHRSIDHLRRRSSQLDDAALEDAEDVALPAVAADDALAGAEDVRHAIARFSVLAPLQRAAVILKDVLGYSLDDIAITLETTVPAVKAALHRGRSKLGGSSKSQPFGPAPFTPVVARYVELFNARDWDAVRAMLADDVKLDLISRDKRQGAASVGHYFTNYDGKHDWHLSVAQLEGREVIAVSRSVTDATPAYLIELTVRDGRIAVIRDFRYVRYVVRDATFA